MKILRIIIIYIYIYVCSNYGKFFVASLARSLIYIYIYICMPLPICTALPLKIREKEKEERGNFSCYFSVLKFYIMQWNLNLNERRELFFFFRLDELKTELNDERNGFSSSSSLIY
jgi:hypothetical protein